MSKADQEVIKKEEEAIAKNLKSPRIVPPDSREDDMAEEVLKVAMQAKESQKGLLDVIKKEIRKKVDEQKRPQKVVIENTPEVKVAFPEVQKVEGMIRLRKEIEALREELTKKTTQEVEGNVTAEVVFPDVQKIEGDVRAQVVFPDVQEIKGSVVADVTFPEVQKVKGDVTTNVPVVEGLKFKAVPVVFTDGAKIINPFTQQVQSHGNLVNALERTIAAIKAISVSGAGGNGAILDGVDSGIKATVFDKTSSNPLAAAIVDADGAQITSFGGGTQYTEGDTDASITGTAVMWEDTSDTLRAVSASKPLPVELKAGSAAIGTLGANSGVDIGDVTINNASGGSAVNIQDGGNTITVDGSVTVEGLAADATAASGSPVRVGGVYNVSSPPTYSAGQIGDLQIGTRGALKVELWGAGATTSINRAADNTDGAAASSGTDKLFVINRNTVFNGTTWDRMYGDTTNGLDVDVTRMAALVANSGVDIGDVTINNASGASAVNIQDGGNSVTVDNGGTFVVQENGAVLTALQLIDDTVFAADAAGASPKGILNVWMDDLGIMRVAQKGRPLPISGGIHGNVTTSGTVTTSGVGISAVRLTTATGVSVMDDPNQAVRVNVVAGGAGNGSILDGVDTNIKATVFDYTGANPLAVRLTDTDGNYAAAGAGTQYTEGDTDASITGSAMMWEDTSDTLRAVSASKPLPVELKAGSAAIGTLAANSGVDIGDVTINNASGASAVNIQDGGNSITIDGTVGVSGTVAVTQSGTWDEVGINDSGNSITVDAADLDIRDLTSASDSVSVHGDVGIMDQLDLANSNPLTVAIVDATGDQITSFGGGTQYANNASSVTPTGTLDMWLDDLGVMRAAQKGRPLPITGGINGNVTVSGTTTVSGTFMPHTMGQTIVNRLEDIMVSVQLLDNAISGNEIQVDVITMPTVTVTATDLDIRNLVFATDKVDISGSTLAANSGVDIGDVTINNASGGSAVNIQDGGNTITVDAVNLDIRDIDAATDDITIHGDVGIVDQLDLANSNPLTVAVVDATGDQITSFGGGTQYANGDIDITPIGTVSMWIDDLGVARSVQKAHPFPISGSVRGNVTISGTTTISGTFTPHTLTQRLVDILESQRTKTATGTLTGTTQTVEVNTDGMSSVAIDISGTFSASVVFEGTTDGTNYNSVYASYNDGLTGMGYLTGTNSANEYIIPVNGYRSIRVRCSAFTSGAIVVDMRATLSAFFPNFQVVQEGQTADTNNDRGTIMFAKDDASSTYRILSLNNATYGLKVGGDKANDATDDGLPLKIGGKATSTPPASVSSGDRVNAWFDEKGRLHSESEIIQRSDILAGSGNVPLSILRQPINTSTTGATLISGLANRRIRVLNGVIMSPTAVTVQLKSANNSDVTGPLPLGATGGFQIPEAEIGDFETQTGQSLTVVLSSAVQVGGWLTFVYV